MALSLAARIQSLVQQVLGGYQGAWLVWCDHRGDWLPLLRIAASTSPGGFTLVEVGESTADEVGSPAARRDLQHRLDAKASFVLHLPASPDRLGWLWAQALQAERVYSRTPREQLVEWGWKPHSLTIADYELALLARQHVDKDPAEWGGGGLQPDRSALLEVLAGGAEPDPGQRLILDLTIEASGLPPLDEANLPRWRSAALARLLVTQAHEVAPDFVSKDHELLVPFDQRALALDLLASWSDSLRLRKGLPDAILEADRLASLRNLPVTDVDSEPFFSHAAEQAVFAAICTRLGSLGGKDLLEATAGVPGSCEHHARGFWGDDCRHPLAIPWGELLRLAEAAGDIVEASPKAEWGKPDDAIAWYASVGWRVDRAGSELARTLDRASPELLALIQPLRAAYFARWEALLLRWSELWESAGCPLPPLPTAGKWASEVLRAPRPTAILVLDALRYDLGVGLAQRIDRHEGAKRSEVVPARAPLPSITALGMGAALPIEDRDLTADIVDGKWRLLYSGRNGEVDLSVAAQRRAWLKEHVGVSDDGFLSLGEVLAGKVPSPEQRRTRLVVADDAIDKLGHDDQLELSGSAPTLDRYVQAIARLRDAGWLRVLVVTDHGFIHWTVGEEKSVPLPVPEAAYISRRAVAYPAAMTVPGPSVLAPGGKWRVAVARGASSFRAYGGLGYFHGGASLQEWVIPCVKVEWPLKAQPVGIELQGLPQVLSQRPRVTLLVVRSSLLVEESIPRQVDVLIRDARKRTILFRSEAISVTPDQDQVAVTVPSVAGVVAERGTTLEVEVRDKRDDSTICFAESSLMTELTDW